jgi:PII-like signaling protein
MLQPGKALRVLIYLSDGTTHKGTPTAHAIIDFLYKNGVSGATALKGFAGFGADHHLHSSASIFLADKLPLKIEFVDMPEKIEAIMPTLKELSGTGMIVTHEISVIKTAG